MWEPVPPDTLFPGVHTRVGTPEARAFIQEGVLSTRSLSVLEQSEGSERGEALAFQDLVAVRQGEGPRPSPSQSLLAWPGTLLPAKTVSPVSP